VRSWRFVPALGLGLVLWVAPLALGLGPLPPAETIELPTPAAAQVQQDQLIKAVGGRPDRLLASDVPGPVTNHEVIRVGLGADGTPVSVQADQRLGLTGEGDYAIRERGPARSATSLTGEPPPVTRRGAVVWQGFSPGRRDLAARLVLDPQIEASRLPLSVDLSFSAGNLGPGGQVPGSGTLKVTITNRTAQPQVLPTAAEIPGAAAVLDRLATVAARPSAARLPSTTAGLPTSLPATAVASVQSTQAVPLRLTGAFTFSGTTGNVRGPATRPDGSFEGTLGGSLPAQAGSSVDFEVDVAGPGRVGLRLMAVAALNPAELKPPRPFASWRAWAGSKPDAQARRAAADLLVALAATGARASSYSPYLGADLVGSGSTEFRWSLAEPAPVTVAAEALRPRRGALAAAGLLLVLVLTGAVLLWRRS